MLPRRALLASALLIPTATAAAAIPNIDVWSGKAKHHKQSFLSINHLRSGGPAQVDFTVTCKADGMSSAYGLTASGHIRHGKLKVTSHKAYNGTGAGYLQVRAKLPIGHRATGRVKWKVPASVVKGCKGSAAFTGKYALSHGG